MSTSAVISVSEPSQAAEARHEAARLARDLAFSPNDSARLVLIVAEAASNLYKHASAGELIISPWQGAEGLGLQVLALDRGPGMGNIARSLSDGYSTSGSQGIGLGGIQRQADLFDVHSHPGLGTIVLAVVLGEPARPLPRPEVRMEMASVGVPLRGQQISGDAWAAEQGAERCTLLLADGLGHGPEAAEAAAEAVNVLRLHPLESPKSLVELAHKALAPTRGAAVAVAELRFREAEVRYAGVGNIRSLILTQGNTRNLVSLNGIVGHQVHKVQQYTYAWDPGAVLLMASDGLTTSWDLSRYPGFQHLHSGLIAGLLYRDFRRGTDDATIVVARQVSAETLMD